MSVQKVNTDYQRLVAPSNQTDKDNSNRPLAQRKYHASIQDF
jgi:hypothetical protein